MSICFSRELNRLSSVSLGNNIRLACMLRLVPSRYLNFNFIGIRIGIYPYIYRSVPKVDARKGKREGEGKNN